MDARLQNTDKTQIQGSVSAQAPTLPDYMIETYEWAYINPRMVALLDRPWVVNFILWGNAQRLIQAMLAELLPGQHVLQPAAVYGDFSNHLARHLGSSGRLEVLDITPIQVAHTQTKLLDFPYSVVRHADAAISTGDTYDAIACFFLLHETPNTYKHRIVDTLLGSVKPGGKAVFIDYHQPHTFHPLRPLMSLVLDTLEPYAKDLYRNPISHYAAQADAFNWTTETYFGGLYQKTVAVRK